MDYKIEFYKNVNSVSKSNINKMGLENMFDYYNGNDVSFLRFVATLNNNNWKASKETETDDYVVYKFFSDIYSNKLYIYYFKKRTYDIYIYIYLMEYSDKGDFDKFIQKYNRYGKLQANYGYNKNDRC